MAESQVGLAMLPSPKLSFTFRCVHQSDNVLEVLTTACTLTLVPVTRLLTQAALIHSGDICHCVVCILYEEGAANLQDHLSPIGALQGFTLC